MPLHALVATHAALQQALDLVLGDAGSIVLHPQFQATPPRAGRAGRPGAELDPVAAALQLTIKQALDPAGILNPGKGLPL